MKIILIDASKNIFDELRRAAVDTGFSNEVLIDAWKKTHVKETIPEKMPLDIIIEEMEPKAHDLDDIKKKISYKAQQRLLPKFLRS